VYDFLPWFDKTRRRVQDGASKGDGVGKERAPICWLTARAGRTASSAAARGEARMARASCAGKQRAGLAARSAAARGGGQDGAGELRRQAAGWTGGEIGSGTRGGQDGAG